MRVQESKNRDKGVNTFPYLHSDGPQNTSGSLGASDPKSHVDIPESNGLEIAPNLRGTLFPSGVGDTYMVDTNTTGHNVLAGNS